MGESVADAQLPEKLTLEVAAATLTQLQPVLSSRSGEEVTLDAGGLKEFDSSAVAVLLELRRELLRQGRRLKVLNWPSRLRELIALYGVAELLPA
ncbi:MULTISPECIES: STAS domain-containing protein [Hydrogenophaga]|uniref:STAS domain-containing protein n=1 Tax=Hydrogenophaga electricum TaxID=1230953 RepID=A0ABQ6C6P0_9BURK|nr:MULTISPECIES: STAS domain-containing protein [Hydrogenophaga]GLS14684.1 hypothetical protein GCM10007935_21160 [Hydrogenophaga electricum]